MTKPAKREFTVGFWFTSRSAEGDSYERTRTIKARCAKEAVDTLWGRRYQEFGHLCDNLVDAYAKKDGPEASA
jgi:hypothetical protein